MGGELDVDMNARYAASSRVALVLDDSGSMGGKRIIEAKAAAIDPPERADRPRSDPNPAMIGQIQPDSAAHRDPPTALRGPGGDCNGLLDCWKTDLRVGTSCF